jgi:hypothetical protein
LLNRIADALHPGFVQRLVLNKGHNDDKELIVRRLTFSGTLNTIVAAYLYHGFVSVFFLIFPNCVKFLNSECGVQGMGHIIGEEAGSKSCPVASPNVSSHMNTWHELYQ